MIKIKSNFLHKHFTPIIPAIARELLETELTTELFIKNTNNGGNKIYQFTAQQAPNLMREVGRLRELSFRDAGGGTGKEIDIDDFDTMEHPFIQLIVWNPKDREIVGGYRYIKGIDIKLNADGLPHSPTAELFRFSDTFNKEYLPFSIEFGRSFVQPLYQPSNNLRKGMFSLHNIWDGIGYVLSKYADVKYIFGKMTMYPHYNRKARNIILCFLHQHFNDNEELLKPFKHLNRYERHSKLERLFCEPTYEENYKILLKTVRKFNETVPPLFNAYMNLSPTMKFCGTALNAHFGNVDETAIIITIDDIYEIKKDRYFPTTEIQ